MKNTFIFRQAVSLITIAILLISMTNCSSIMNGSKQEVSFNSEPNGAKIFINGVSMGTTPTKLMLKRGETHIIEIRLDGYKTYRITTSKGITGWFWGNLICGGIIGFVIDLATGNAFDIDPDTVFANLEKGDGAMDSFQLENFGSIYINDENGNHIGTIDVVWK